ncbi:hypothetical protein HN020_14980 [Brevibacillus borstelensis]|jgi:hypothetical protein|uniref:hypothetical protein n=1 Tax=Brevibacillus borstelensis TaxID=45462 RepID=UPI0014900EFE|nr:hypothetical protein [Brevibacillus borstelensis]MCM3625601.1 hypothetical protein [Brevibacillus borstelensis]NOU56034.1 hypothetical protein [Brevibacillus borstelensis]
MGGFFNERVALEKTLNALLEQRASWRSDYVERDRQFAAEIKEVLNRIRELDELHELHGSQTRMEKTETKPIESEVSNKQFAKKSQKTRRTYQYYDYPRISQEIESILEETSPVKMSELYQELQKRLQVDWSNPYIILHKALSFSERIHVEKFGRKLFFSLREFKDT